MKKYTKDHEWIMEDDNGAVVGITDYAQKQLGDVVYVSLTGEVGDEVSAGDDIAEIESVKSVSQIYAPIDCKISGFNSDLEDESNCAIINEDPYGKGWILKIEISDKSQLDGLMDEKDYLSFIETL